MPNLSINIIIWQWEMNIHNMAFPLKTCANLFLSNINLKNGIDTRQLCSTFIMGCGLSIIFFMHLGWVPQRQPHLYMFVIDLFKSVAFEDMF